MRLRCTRLLTLLLLTLLLTTFAPFNCIAYDAEEPKESFDLMTMFLVALTLTDIPLNNVEKYELFHTVVINQSELFGAT